MACVDVAELDAAPDGALALGRRLPAGLFGVHRRDHFGDPARPLGDQVRERIECQDGSRPRGRILLLTQPRVLGFAFNPVSFFYCLGPDEAALEGVLAEVTNTPWGERHLYALTPGGEGAAPRLEATATKALHVSPFFEMEHDYHFSFSLPGERLKASITNRSRTAPAGSTRVFDAGLVLERRRLDTRTALRTLARHPWMPVATLLGIHAQALRLAIKGAPFHPHPRHRAGSPQPEEVRP